VAELVDLALEVQSFCAGRGWKFCLIGGMAVQQWSEPRLTWDVDITLLTGFGGEETYIDEWLRHYRPRFPDARDFALANRVLLLWSQSGLGIDVALGALPFEERAIARSKEVEIFPGINLRVCSPEDLIVMKAFASREIDWRDIEMTIARQGSDTLDWPQIFEELEPLAALKEEPEIISRLKKLREESGKRAK
jgi:hypothetical protein